MHRLLNPLCFAVVLLATALARADDLPDPLKPSPNQAENTGERVYERLVKSTALILVKVPGGKAMGSGILIDSKNRLVITNLQLVDQHLDVVVLFPLYHPDGKMETSQAQYAKLARSLDKPICKVLATDSKRDLAVIQLQKLPDGIIPLRLAANEPKSASDVHSVGNPSGTDSVFTYNSGKVKQIYDNDWLVEAEGRGRAYHFKARIVTTKSPANPGDSGGPLVNNKGDLVGITDGRASDANTLSTFIAASEIKAFLEEVLLKLDPPIRWQPATEPGLDAAAPRFTVDGLLGLQRVLKEDTAPQRRAEAARAIGSIGFPARSAIPNLLEAIKDSDDKVSTAAMQALGKLGSANEAVLPVLIDKSLKDSDRRVKLYAARAIGKMGAAGERAIDSLIELTRDPDSQLHKETLLALGRVGAGDRDKVFPMLFGQLKAARDQPTRTLLAEALSQLGEPSVKEIANLKENLNHSSSEMRVYCARALGQLGTLAKDAVPALMQSLKHEDKPTAIASAAALGEIGAGAKSAIPALLEALQDRNHLLSKASTEALVAIAGQTRTEGAFANADMATLVAALKNSRVHVKTGALTVLAVLGPDARDSIPAVGVSLLKDPDRSIRIQAALSLARFAPADGPVPVLIEALAEKDQDPELRTAVIHALGQYGTQAKAAISRLDDILKEAAKDKYVDLLMLRAAITALGCMKADKVVGDHMLNLLSDREPKMELIPVISKAYGKMGPTALPCVDRLLGSKDPAVRIFGARAISDMAAEILETKTPEGITLRQGVIRALGNYVDGEIDPLVKKELELALDKVKGAI